MQVLALLGSPRKKGNSDLLTDEVLKGLKSVGASVDKIYLDDFQIRPIGEVIDDSRNREDSRADDDYPQLLKKFLEANLIIWATPIYWYGVSAQMKCFIDRFSSYFRNPHYADKFYDKGHIVLCTFGSDVYEYSRFITEPMKLIIQILRGNYIGDICVPDCYQKGKILEKKDELAKAYDLGKKAGILMDDKQFD
ncbi:MAG: flavodoxin family protein [Promethearchaeota archaeon]